jgi:hypothetical protein
MASNDFDNTPIDRKSFSYRDLLGQDLWDSFTVAVSLAVVGTPTYVGRYRIVGAQCFFQVTLVATTSIASTAGTHYVTLPIAAKGLAGDAAMTNRTGLIAVGTCHIDVATSRAYLPAQVASGDTFQVAGWYEIEQGK